GLAAGTFDVRLRDAANPTCIVTLNPALTLTQPAQFTATVTGVDDTSPCANNGQILITNVTGGNPPYQYSVDGGATWSNSPTFAGLAPGGYTVLILKLNAPNCQTTLAAVTINGAAALSATVSSTNITGCAGNTNGTIIIAGAAGGSGAYEYTIN